MIVYRASELGSCIKRQVAIRMGYTPFKPPDKMQAVFDRGSALEVVVLDRLMQDGIIAGVQDQQLEVALPVSDEIFVVGHVDGRSYEDTWGTSVTIEVKTMTEANYKKFLNGGLDADVELFAAYRWQTSVYQIALDAPIMVVAWNREAKEPEYSYRMYEKPFYDKTEIRTRVLIIEAAARQGLLPDTCSKRDYPCPVFYLHGDEKVDVEDDAGLDLLGVTYLEAKAGVDTAKKHLEVVRGQVEKALSGRGRVRTEHASFSVYSTTRKTIDKELMKEAGLTPELYEKSNTYQNLRVTERKVETNES